MDTADPRRGLRTDTEDEAGGEGRAGFFAEARRRPPEEIVDVLVEHVRREGALVAEIYLVDVQQVSLLPFPRAGLDRGLAPLSLDGTLAGRCYQDGTTITTGTLDPDDEGATEGGGTHTWFPLRRGAERLGVARVDSDRPLLAETLERLDNLFDAFVHVVSAVSDVSDALIRARRTEPMDLAAEIQWSLLPPLSWTDRRCSISAVLEPAYDVAGDSVDYNVDGRQLSLAVFDGMGHGLDSARTASLTVNAYRNLRRSGASLPELAAQLSSLLNAVMHDDAFTTAVLAELDLTTGELCWVNAGHLDPLLFRDTRFVGEIVSTPRQRPLGMRDPGAEEPPPVVMGRAVLEPGDAVLLYTDGVTEARDNDRDQFGVERLSDRVSAHLASGLAAQEIARRISHAVQQHSQGRLEDDATLLLVQWQGPDSGESSIGEPLAGAEPDALAGQ